MYHDCEIYADAYELEQAYALECNTELALETAITEQRISEINRSADDLLERMDASLEAVKTLRTSMNTSTEQTEEETKMFEAWLS